MFKMRNNGTRGYTGYRGRTGDGKKWLILALALVILAGAVFLFAQRYRVYRSDGSSYIEMPWSRRADAGETSAEETPAAPVGDADAKEG